MDKKETKVGSAGGKARAIIEKQQAQERLEKYNDNPRQCECCGKPMYAKDPKHLQHIKRKRFCSHTCAAKCNNLSRILNRNKTYIDKFSDEEILSIIDSSFSISEMMKKLGYSSNSKRHLRKTLKERIKSLGYDDIKNFFAEKRLKEKELIHHIKQKKDIKNKDHPSQSFQIYTPLLGTKKELFDRRVNYQSARGTIGRDAREAYLFYERPPECIICGYNKHIDVAHIVAVKDFSDDTLLQVINHIDNLIALCPNHHWEYDHNKLDENDSNILKEQIKIQNNLDINSIENCISILQQKVDIEINKSQI